MKQKRAHRKGEPNPLAWFLAQTFDEPETRLSFLASVAATEPFDADKLRSELMAKLKRLRYPQPEPTRNERTFYEILETARVLDGLLKRTELTRLWQCLLLRKIAERDRELEKKGESVHGLPLRFHRKLATETYRHLTALEQIRKKHPEGENFIAEYRELVGKEFRRQVKLALQSRYAGSREELLGGHRDKEFRHVPKKEELATKEAVYWELKNGLQTEVTRRKGVSNQFLRQLALLVCADPDATGLEEDESLRKAIQRR